MNYLGDDIRNEIQQHTFDLPLQFLWYDESIDAMENVFSIIESAVAP